MMCFKQVLDSLMSQGNCMIRIHDEVKLRLTLPFYVLNTPALVERRDHALSQLRRHGAADITIVHCANREDIVELPPLKVHCLHPRMAPTVYAKAQPELVAGTLSLAVKHTIAMYDVLRRHLRCGAILEDDAFLHPRFGIELNSYLPDIPVDAAVFYLGSYSRIHGTFRQGHRDQGWPQVPNTHPNTTLYMRNNSGGILGGIGYIIFERGARAIVRPIVAPADIMISHQLEPIGAPGPTYGSADYLVWPAPYLQGKKGGSHYVDSKGRATLGSGKLLSSGNRNTTNAVG